MECFHIDPGMFNSPWKKVRRPYLVTLAVQYTQSYQERFSLSEEQSAALTEPPTIVLSLPDGSRLRAVAYGGDSFPAINIYWDTGLHNVDGPICFAEYNPERSPCHEVCIGAYQSDKDDTTYYKPYMAERDLDEEN